MQKFFLDEYLNLQVGQKKSQPELIKLSDILKCHGRLETLPKIMFAHEITSSMYEFWNNCVFLKTDQMNNSLRGLISCVPYLFIFCKKSVENKTCAYSTWLSKWQGIKCGHTNVHVHTTLHKWRLHVCMWKQCCENRSLLEQIGYNIQLTNWILWMVIFITSR